MNYKYPLSAGFGLVAGILLSVGYARVTRTQGPEYYIQQRRLEVEEGHRACFRASGYEVTQPISESCYFVEHTVTHRKFEGCVNEDIVGNEKVPHIYGLKELGVGGR